MNTIMKFFDFFNDGHEVAVRFSSPEGEGEYQWDACPSIMISMKTDHDEEEKEEFVVPIKQPDVNENLTGITR
jgi:hypothetical protein